MLIICLLGTYFVPLPQNFFYRNSITFLIDAAKITTKVEITKFILNKVGI